MRVAGPRTPHPLLLATLLNQDLALVPLMAVRRNFFLGAEPTRGFGPLRRAAPGGERQSVAVARVVYFGARALVLDEPTSALGVKRAGVLLRYIVRARERGLAGCSRATRTRSATGS